MSTLDFDWVRFLRNYRPAGAKGEGLLFFLHDKDEFIDFMGKCPSCLSTATEGRDSFAVMRWRYVLCRVEWR